MSWTLIIVLFTSAVSLVGFLFPTLIEALSLWPPIVREKNEYYRLATYGLVHANLMHLAFNMITLYSFGSVMEGFYDAALGHLGFVFFYVVGLIVSILPTYLKSSENPNRRSLGASGAICAVLFGSVLLHPWSSMYIIPIPVPIPAIVLAVLYVAYSLYASRRTPDPTAKSVVSHSGHLWGAAYGVVFTIAMKPQVWTNFLQALSKPHF